MKTLVVQLDRLEDNGSIRDKVIWGKSSRVLLVWPVNYSVLNRKVDLVSIKRICTSQGSRLGIVCDDPDVIAEAEDLQIPVFNSVNQAMRKGWDRRRSRKQANPQSPDVDSRGGIEEIRQRNGLVKSNPPLSFPVRLTLLISALVLVVIAGLIILPSATVRIYPLGQAREMNVQFIAHGSETGTAGPDTLPARVVEITVEAATGQPATGFLPVADAKANGILTISNTTNSEITIPPGTIVMSNSTPPVRYQITQMTMLPPQALTTGVPFEAIYGGKSGNAEAGAINRIDGEFGLQLELSNPEPAAGGTDRKIPAPSQDDILAVKNDLRRLLLQEAERKISSELMDDEILLPATIKTGKILEEQTQPEAGHAGSTVNIKQKVMVSAMVIDRKNLTEKAQAILEANLVLPGWKEAEDEPVSVQILSQEYDNLTNTVKVNTLIKGRTVPIVDTDSIRSAILGKSMDAAATLIATRVISEKPTEFITWPIQLPILPMLETRIKVTIP